MRSASVERMGFDNHVRSAEAPSCQHSVAPSNPHKAPQDIADYRPGGTGHVLITSRFPGWGALGGRLEVDVLTRPETIALLRARIPTLNEELADKLADKLAAELGDLPLAAAQTAAYLEQTALPLDDYLHQFRARRASLLTKGDVV